MPGNIFERWVERQRARDDEIAREVNAHPEREAEEASPGGRRARGSAVPRRPRLRKCDPGDGAHTQDMALDVA